MRPQELQFFLVQYFIPDLAKLPPDGGQIEEIPYALPPGRFEDPVPLPDNYRYEDKEYILETACKSSVLNKHRWWRPKLVVHLWYRWSPTY